MGIENNEISLKALII